MTGLDTKETKGKNVTFVWWNDASFSTFWLFNFLLIFYLYVTDSSATVARFFFCQEKFTKLPSKALRPNVCIAVVYCFNIMVGVSSVNPIHAWWKPNKPLWHLKFTERGHTAVFFDKSAVLTFTRTAGSVEHLAGGCCASCFSFSWQTFRLVEGKVCVNKNINGVVAF